MRIALVQSILAASLVTSFAVAQEVKRPERMEGATGAAADTHSSTPVSTFQRPRLPGLLGDGLTVLHNQWSLNPAGNHLELGDFPVDIAVHPAGQFAAVLHSGQSTHEVVVVQLKGRTVVARVTIPESFYGLCFSPDGSHLFASGGEFDVVHRWTFGTDGLLSEHAAIRIVPMKESFVVGGLSMSADGSKLFACGTWGSRIAITNPDGESSPTFIELEKGSYPYSALPSPDGKRLFVSLWGASSVAVINLDDNTVSAKWKTLSHPTEMTLSPDGERLFVACSNSNSVTVLDAESGQATEVLATALYPGAENGSTPTSLAVSKDGSILLVANADNNNLAVFNVAQRGTAKSLGFIPTGWHPTSVRFDPAGDILVACGKGLSPKTNRHGPVPGGPARSLREYIGGLHTGAMSWIKFPAPGAMATYTAQAFACSPLQKDSAVVSKRREEGNPIPEKLGDASPIKHCIYVIKENRTYDQVFGDIKEGNGDASLCLFPENVTPNLHALVKEFVLLDNFYVESEVSADGHEWSMAAYATDFVERTWPLNYRKQPKESEIKYPSEGSHDIAVPAGGYIWDRCAEAGVSYRSYGEWVENGATPSDPGRAKVKALEGHIDPLYRSYDIGYSDLDRVKRFKEELARFEKEGSMPQFMVVRIPNDHTAGTRVDGPTPTALVAQNDLAVGQFVEAISKSSFWKETAIFVVEDDAQNGSDHVDAHRTTALVVSPWTKRHHVDSSLYSTSSMLRTMELILGLKPMSQFDAAALPMFASFSKTPDMTAYAARDAQVDLDAKNLASAWGAELSAELELAVEDAADDLVLNEIIWKSVRGADSEMPPPVRAAFVFSSAKAGEDDDD
jgi:DNA-binding beta-propeller fold protein YncE